MAAMFPGFEPGPPPNNADLAIRAWNLMGGIDAGLLPYAVEIFGITDVETFLMQLAAIRDHQNDRAAG